MNFLLIRAKEEAYDCHELVLQDIPENWISKHPDENDSSSACEDDFADEFPSVHVIVNVVKKVRQ